MPNRLMDVGTLLLVIMLPFAGALLAGREPREFLQFPPPLSVPSDYLRFSWVAAGAVIVGLVAFAAPWMARAMRVVPRASPRLPALAHDPEGRFPPWGWMALAWTLAWWVAAWTRLPVLEPVQRFTFFPLWIGFIVVFNGIVQRRTGRCMMTRAPHQWLVLFVLSACFWWGFEWLNRFVRNWHYLGVQDFDTTAYVLHASLCFSTVLPAVAAVAEWLRSYPRWQDRTASGPAWTWLEHRGTGTGLFALGVAALVLTGMFPRWCYPALWVAPLALLLAEAMLWKTGGLAREMARGNWTRAATWMTAALVCGIFWELWNWHSLAKWIYTVPGVERWKVFEMPLLGYAGYLPFGLECLLVVERGLGTRFTTPTAPPTPLSATRVTR